MKKQQFRGFQSTLRKESLRLYCLDLHHSLPNITPRLPVTIDASTNLHSLFNRDASIVKQRLKHGNIIFTAHDRSRLVAYLFATEQECRVNEIDDRFIIKSGEIYLYDAYTDQDYRGNRIYSALMTSAAHYFKELSYSHALIFTSTKNRPSVKAIESIGFSCYEVINHYNICGWKIWKYHRLNGRIKSLFQNEV